MICLYVSGPYRDKRLRGVIDNIRRAELIAIELWKMGYSVWCPHKNTELFPDGAGEDEEYREIPYIEGDLALLDRFMPGKDGIVMIPGWRQSEGAREELQRSFENGLKIYFWPVDRARLQALSAINLRRKNEQAGGPEGDTISEAGIKIKIV